MFFFQDIERKHLISQRNDAVGSYLSSDMGKAENILEISIFRAWVHDIFRMERSMNECTDWMLEASDNVEGLLKPKRARAPTRELGTTFCKVN